MILKEFIVAFNDATAFLKNRQNIILLLTCSSPFMCSIFILSCNTAYEHRLKNLNFAWKRNNLFMLLFPLFYINLFFAMLSDNLVHSILCPLIWQTWIGPRILPLLEFCSITKGPYKRTCIAAPQSTRCDPSRGMRQLVDCGSRTEIAR